MWRCFTYFEGDICFGKHDIGVSICFLSGDHHDLIKNAYIQSFADLKWEPKSKQWGATYTCWNHCASKSGAFDHPQHED